MPIWLWLLQCILTALDVDITVVQVCTVDDQVFNHQVRRPWLRVLIVCYDLLSIFDLVWCRAHMLVLLLWTTIDMFTLTDMVMQVARAVYLDKVAFLSLVFALVHSLRVWPSFFLGVSRLVYEIFKGRQVLWFKLGATLYNVNIGVFDFFLNTMRGNFWVLLIWVNIRPTLLERLPDLIDLTEDLTRALDLSLQLFDTLRRLTRCSPMTCRLTMALGIEQLRLLLILGLRVIEPIIRQRVLVWSHLWVIALIVVPYVVLVS